MDEKKEEQEKKGRKIDNLINLVENHTRTERHLEQYSNIGKPEFKKQARDKQDIREKQIDELKYQLCGSEKCAPTAKEQIEDIKENYELGKQYYERYKENMSEEDLQNLQRKQENRKTNLQNLED